MARSAAVGFALLSSDFDKLSSVFETLDAAAVYVEHRGPFERALAHLACRFKLTLLSGEDDTHEPSDASTVAALRSQVGPDTVAKTLFTSGSTGTPKGVINTHRMWATNQEQLRHAWPFLVGTAPLSQDWLPSNHTFGGNHNFGLVLRNGGTLYIDDGKATDPRRRGARPCKRPPPPAWMAGSAACLGGRACAPAPHASSLAQADEFSSRDRTLAPQWPFVRR